MLSEEEVLRRMLSSPKTKPLTPARPKPKPSTAWRPVPSAGSSTAKASPGLPPTNGWVRASEADQADAAHASNRRRRGPGDNAARVLLAH